MSKKQFSPYDGAVLRRQRDERLAAQTDPAEQARRSLANHERAIENARRSFVALGQALHAIRTERLYAGEFSTFAEYLESRWDVSEAYANRMINAALVAIEATPIGVEINSEAVARELVGLGPEVIRQIWDEATRRVAGGRITAALIKEVRRSLEPPKAPVLEGEIVDPLESFPAVEKALEDFHDNQTSGLAGASPADEPGEDRPGGDPGEAEADHSAADVTTPSATPTDPEAPPASDASGSVNEPERAEDAGVSSPPAPDPKDEDDPERVEHEMRTRMSERFCESIVTLSRGAASRDPIEWLEDTYLPGAYKMRGLPGVNNCFEPDALRLLAARLNMIADHLDETGMKLP